MNLFPTILKRSLSPYGGQDFYHPKWSISADHDNVCAVVDWQVPSTRSCNGSWCLQTSFCSSKTTATIQSHSKAGFLSVITPQLLFWFSLFPVNGSLCRLRLLTWVWRQWYLGAWSQTNGHILVLSSYSPLSWAQLWWQSKLACQPSIRRVGALEGPILVELLVNHDISLHGILGPWSPVHLKRMMCPKWSGWWRTAFTRLSNQQNQLVCHTTIYSKWRSI